MYCRWRSSYQERRGEPILLYESVVWGYENLEILERVHLRFCKRILNLRLSTPNFMVYGELGRHHLNIRVQLRMISFWCKLIQNENKLSGILYKLMFNLQTNDGYDFRWISHIRSVLDRTGLGYIFTSQIHVKFCNLKPLLFERLQINLFRYGFPILKTRPEVNSMRHSKQNFPMKTICLDYLSLEESRYQN